jgi:DNA-binding response OmpR family regulator
VVTRQAELMSRLGNLLTRMDVAVHYAGASLTAALAQDRDFDFDLVMLDGDADVLKNLAGIEEALFAEDAPSLFILINADELSNLRLPVRLNSDFMVLQATDAELAVRVHHLLWPGEEAGSSDFVRAGSLTINLATYQVKVDGAVLDLTYLEYALLAFLVTHPGRTYSRDALLRRVWGFEYYGGSRTVDVHVRRVRAKLGPELAQHLETIRGVGYLWNT